MGIQPLKTPVSTAKMIRVQGLGSLGFRVQGSELNEIHRHLLCLEESGEPLVQGLGCGSDVIYQEPCAGFHVRRISGAQKPYEWGYYGTQYRVRLYPPFGV